MGMARMRLRAGAKSTGIACLLAVLTAGCSSMIGRSPRAIDPSGNPVSSLIPSQTLQLTPRISLGAENLLLGAALYWAVDPLAPNWQLQEASLGPDRVHIALRKKRFTSGGDGEGAQMFARRAGQLARDGGYAGYSVMEYTEGIESALPLAQRVAQGVIRLNR